MARQGPHRKFSEEFKRRAVERMQTCDKVTDLAKELGIYAYYLYNWERKLKGAPVERKPQVGEAPPPTQAEEALREEVKQLREALGKRALEVEFFRGALQRIEARRRNSEESGGMASTRKSVE